MEKKTNAVQNSSNVVNYDPDEYLYREAEFAPTSTDKEAEIAPTPTDKETEIAPAPVDKKAEIAPTPTDKNRINYDPDDYLYREV